MQPVFVAVLSETLTDRFVETVTPPPRRYERTDEYGRPLETAIDVYMDTQVRSLGLLVFDHGFKTYAVRPRRLPKGVSPLERRYVKERGVDIGRPGWVSKSHQHVLTVDRARIEAKRLIALMRSWSRGTGFSTEKAPWCSITTHLDSLAAVGTARPYPRLPRIWHDDFVALPRHSREEKKSRLAKRRKYAPR